MMKGKLGALVYGTVRPIAGSLLVAGALFCLGLMSVRAQTVDLESGLVAYYPFNGNANDESGGEFKWVKEQPIGDNAGAELSQGCVETG